MIRFGTDRPVVTNVLFAAIALCLGLQAWLALVTEFNWDEFFYLSHIYSYQRGESTGALQRLHVHLFGWLTRLPGDEIDQLEVGRLVMLLCEAGTCAFIYRLARSFFDPVPSLLAVLAFASAGFTIMHGASFRADPLATALMMLSLATLARGRATALTMLVVAASAAVGALVTVKVIFYAPAFAGIALWRISEAQDRRRILRWMGATALATAVLFAAMYTANLFAMSRASNANAQAMLGNAGRATILDAGLLPRANEINRAAGLAPFQAALMLVAITGLTVSAVRTLGNSRVRAVTILSCAAPLLCLFFYRNAFPYFFPFIAAPATLLVAWTMQEMSLLRSRPSVAAATFVLPAIMIAGFWARERPREAQRQVLSAVHDVFPEPVPYIDRNSMIASFPKRGIFMSTWGMRNYRQRAIPIFGQLLANETVPLLIVNGPALAHAVGVRDKLPAQLALHGLDRRLLRENFIAHWGPIWVAGKRLHVGHGEMLMTVLIPGSYTLEGRAIVLNGRPTRLGDTVELSRGVHRIMAEEPGLVTFRWGKNLPRPQQPAPVEYDYRGF